MKINEILKEDYGYGGVSKSGATGQKYFVDSVTKQLHAYMDSARKTGQPVSTWEFVQSYLTKYGWFANSQQASQLQELCKEVDAAYNKPEPKQQPDNNKPDTTVPNTPAGSERIDPSFNEGKLSNFARGAGAAAGNWASQYVNQKVGQLGSALGLGLVNKLANMMYMVGMTQHRDPRTGSVVSGPQAGTNAQGTVDNPVLSNPSKQIIKIMTPMKGEDYKDDLESIVRLALNNLYKSDPGDYSSEVKRIMGQKTQQNPQNPQV